MLPYVTRIIYCVAYEFFMSALSSVNNPEDQLFRKTIMLYELGFLIMSNHYKSVSSDLSKIKARVAEFCI